MLKSADEGMNRLKLTRECVKSADNTLQHREHNARGRSGLLMASLQLARRRQFLEERRVLISAKRENAPTYAASAREAIGSQYACGVQLSVTDCEPNLSAAQPLLLARLGVSSSCQTRERGKSILQAWRAGFNVLPVLYMSQQNCRLR